MRCISRITNDTYSQKFGDGFHKFYVEERCTVMSPSEICPLCSVKTATKVQQSRKYNHGTINTPIPDHSHIYGSKWYEDAVKKYTAPAQNVIAFAEQYKRNTYATPTATATSTATTTATATATATTPKKRRPAVAKPVKTEVIHKELSIPTHMEKTLDYVDTDGFNIEYIKLHQIEYNGNTYFKDSKNKLYKKIKDNIGPYVGRLEGSDIINIPDSDEE